MKIEQLRQIEGLDMRLELVEHRLRFLPALGVADLAGLIENGAQPGRIRAFIGSVNSCGSRSQKQQRQGNRPACPPLTHPDDAITHRAPACCCLHADVAVTVFREYYRTAPKLARNSGSAHRPQIVTLVTGVVDPAGHWLGCQCTVCWRTNDRFGRSLIA